MLKKYKKLINAGLFFVVLFLAAAPVQAKTYTAKKTALQDVTQAEAVEGIWEDNSGERVFLPATGNLIKNSWIRHQNAVFYLGKAGKEITGWISYRKNLYYTIKESGLVTGWLEKGAKLYYFKEDGTMATGLTKIDGKKYYFGSVSGEAKTGWKTIGKSKYYFDKISYQMVTLSWVKTKGKYYYLNANGKKRKSGWLTINEDKYYLDSDGARVTGDVFINGKGYYFKKNGIYDPEKTVKSEVDTSKPMVALTFDDGLGPYTMRLLNCLEANHAKATFFMLGSSVSNYKSTVKKMASIGCELGNHSYSHPTMSTLSAAACSSEVSRASASIKSAAGVNPTVFRLPYGDGASNASVLSSIGLPSICWSIDTRDWANSGNPQHTVSAVLNHVKSGDIILMHDIHKSTVDAAETIIPALKKRGYQMVTVSQLAKYKGKTTLHSGKTYHHFR